MGWRVSSVMDEKLRFVFAYERDEEPMKALCERFCISRETGYVWLRRYRQCGPDGLAEVNRAPLRHPNQTAVSIEEAVLRLRQAHMTWAPRNHPSDEDLSPGTPEPPQRRRPVAGDPEAEADSGAGPAGARVAGDEHDGRDREACGAGGRAQEAAPDRAVYRAS